MIEYSPLLVYVLLYLAYRFRVKLKCLMGRHIWFGPFRLTGPSEMGECNYGHVTVCLNCGKHK